MNSKCRLSLFIICDFKSLTDEVNSRSVCFCCASRVDKGCYKHTVFWTFNIKITVHRKVSFYGLFLSETDKKTWLIVDFRQEEVTIDMRV